jgi:hypothetical protein
MSYRVVDSFRAGPGWNCSSILVLLDSCVYSACMTYHCSVQWINSWWWTEELSETCRVSWQNKFVKLVFLVGFITKKFVTMHGHMNVKLVQLFRIMILHHLDNYLFMQSLSRGLSCLAGCTLKRGHSCNYFLWPGPVSDILSSLWQIDGWYLQIGYDRLPLPTSVPVNCPLLFQLDNWITVKGPIHPKGPHTL